MRQRPNRLQDCIKEAFDRQNLGDNAEIQRGPGIEVAAIKQNLLGAANADDARRVAKSLINSPLVKTMVHGADPNVGRLLMAVGKVFDAAVTAESTDAWINGYPVVRGGKRLDFDDAVVRATLAAEVVDIEVALGLGDGSATAYGCDLTKGYIDENAAYYSS